MADGRLAEQTAASVDLGAFWTEMFPDEAPGVLCPRCLAPDALQSADVLQCTTCRYRWRQPTLVGMD